MQLYNTLHQKLRNVPVAINGIAISVITLAHFYKQVHLPLVAMLLFGLAILLILIKTIKYILHPDILNSELNNYIQGGYLPLYSMFIAIFAFDISPYSLNTGITLWYVACIMHLALLSYLYYSHWKQRNFSLILPSWFIPPIGFIAVGLSHVDSNTKMISHGIFLFAAIVFIPISFLIIKRQFTKPLNSNEIPTMGIYAAPVSLLLLAYLNYSSINYQSNFLVGLIVINIIYNALSYIGLYLSYCKIPYTPTVASFSFPFAVAAVSFMSCEHIYPILGYLGWITAMTATMVTFHVLYRHVFK